MSQTNPITCTNLDIHESWIDLWVHRKNTMHRYGANWLWNGPNQVLRVERMLKFQSANALRTLHQMDRLIREKSNG